MLRQLLDVLKEVFWLKPSRKKAKPAKRKSPKKTAAKKKKPAKGVKKTIKPVAKKAAPKPAAKAARKPAERGLIDPSLTQLGEITHYFDRIKVCVVKITHGSILIGDKLTILGPKTKFVQKVWSMQIESEDVKVAKKGQLIGLKVDKIVGVGDKVYK